MNCPNCGAPMILHHERATYECSYCQTLHIPEADDQGLRIFDETARHKCPLCNLPLVWVDMDGFPAEYCPNCQGVLLLQHLFGKAVKVLRGRAKTPAVDPEMVNWDHLHRSVRCPSCHKDMSTHVYGGPGNIVIDTCVYCNLIWLDYRELRRVLDTPGRDRAAN